MSLFEQHKAERRARILDAARRLVAERGYDCLTMRELARVANVAVPTLYNLFGSKDAILVAELEASAVRIAAQVTPPGDGFFAGAIALVEGGMRMIEDAPEFHRAVMRAFLTSPDIAPMRQRMESGYIAMMASRLAAAKAAGQLVDWAEPMIVSRHMFWQFMTAFIGWGMGELDLASFRAVALSGICHVLAGVSRGAFAADVEARIRELVREPIMQSLKEVHDVASRSSR